MGEYQNRFAGSIVGLAVGDALGFPLEFCKVDSIKKSYGDKGITDFVQPPSGFPIGTYSDDTQMSIATAKSLIDSSSKPYSLDHVMEKVRDRYVEWANSENNNRFPGNACLQGCKNLEKDVHWSKSGDSWSKGCGAAMRTAPIGLHYDSVDKLVEVSFASSLSTHANPTGIAAGIAAAYLVNLAKNDCEPGTYQERLIDFMSEIERSTNLPTTEFNQKIMEIDSVRNLDSEKAIASLGEGWVGEEAVAIALYCFLESPNDYKKSVLRAANTNGDSDSLACITGAISGAYNGIKGIPENWIETVENKELLFQLSDLLFESSKRI